MACGLLKIKRQVSATFQFPQCQGPLQGWEKDMAVVKTKFLKERRRNIIHYVSSRKRTRKHEMEKCKTKVISFFSYGNKKLIIESVIFHKLHFICLVYCVLQNGSCRLEFLVCTIAYNPSVQRLCGLEFLVCTIAYNPSVQRLCGLVLIAFLEKIR